MTDEPLPETWTTRELPILQAILRRVDSGEDRPDLADIGADTGIPPLQLTAGVEALYNANPPYLDFESASGWGPDRYGGGYVSMVSERARREVGTWPSADSMLQQLIDALERAADTEPREEERSRIRSVAAYLGGAGRDFAVQVLASRLGG